MVSCSNTPTRTAVGHTSAVYWRAARRNSSSLPDLPASYRGAGQEPGGAVQHLKNLCLQQWKSEEELEDTPEDRALKFLKKYQEKKKKLEEEKQKKFEAECKMLEKMRQDLYRFEDQKYVRKSHKNLASKCRTGETRCKKTCAWAASCFEKS